MIPVIEYEIKEHGWLTAQQFTDIIAVAGMSPGPIATNIAVFVGYKVGGPLGAVTSLVAISMPSLLIVFIICLFFNKVKNQQFVHSAFYGLRPVITGLVTYAAIKVAIQNQIITSFSNFHFDTIGVLFIVIGFLLLVLTKISPVSIILLSGVFGIIIYY